MRLRQASRRQDGRRRGGEPGRPLPPDVHGRHGRDPEIRHPGGPRPRPRGRADRSGARLDQPLAAAARDRSRQGLHADRPRPDRRAVRARASASACARRTTIWSRCSIRRSARPGPTARSPGWRSNGSATTSRPERGAGQLTRSWLGAAVAALAWAALAQEALALAVRLAAAGFARPLGGRGLSGVAELGGPPGGDLGLDRRHQGRGRRLLRLGAGALQTLGVVVQVAQRGVFHGRQFGSVHRRLIPCSLVSTAPSKGHWPAGANSHPGPALLAAPSRSACPPLAARRIGQNDNSLASHMVLRSGNCHHGQVGTPAQAPRFRHRRPGRGLDCAAARPHLWDEGVTSSRSSRARKAGLSRSEPAAASRDHDQRGCLGCARDGLNRPRRSSCRRAAIPKATAR